MVSEDAGKGLNASGCRDGITRRKYNHDCYAGISGVGDLPIGLQQALFVLS